MQEVIRDIPVSAGIRRTSAAAGAILMLGGAATVWAVDPTTIRILPVCPLFSLTGLACPGCGLTRGFHALFHGDVLTAMDFNALIPVWVIVFGYLFASLVLTTLRGRGLPWTFISPVVLFGSLVVLLGFGVLRNLPSYPFTVLFP